MTDKNWPAGPYDPIADLEATIEYINSNIGLTIPDMPILLPGRIHFESEEEVREYAAENDLLVRRMAYGGWELIYACDNFLVVKAQYFARINKETEDE